MKKIIALFVAGLLFFTSGYMASEETETMAVWYEITRDDVGKDILTVRLDGNPTTGYDWTFEISEPALLELLSQEYVIDESDEPICGLGGTWVASFRNFSDEAGDVELILRYARSWEENALEERMLRMTVSEEGQIIIHEETVNPNNES